MKIHVNISLHLISFILISFQANTLFAGKKESVEIRQADKMTLNTKSVYHGISLAGYGIWDITDKTPHNISTTAFLTSRSKGENQTSTIESPLFITTQPTIRLMIRGWDTEKGGADNNRFELVNASDGSVLRKASPPQTDDSSLIEWDISDILGHRVFVRVVDDNSNAGFAWLGLDSIDAGTDFQADFAKGRDQLDGWFVPGVKETIRNFYGIPFRAADNSPIPSNGSYDIKIGAAAKRLLLLGMTNSIDQGCPVWAPIEHYSQRYFIGDQLGEIRVNYMDGSKEVYPLILGDSLWWGNITLQHPEPFASDENAGKILNENLRLFPEKLVFGNQHLACIEMQDKVIDEVQLIDFTEKDGVPVIIGLTVETESAKTIDGFMRLEASEIDPKMAAFIEEMPLQSEDTAPKKRQTRLKALRNLLYTTHENFPKSVPVSIPDGYRGPKVKFEGDEYAQVLTNIFYHNLKDMDDRVDETGFYHTSAKDAASWGGYFGFGTWNKNWASYYKHTWARDMGRAVMELTYLGLIDKGLLNADYSILQGRIWEEGKLPEMQLFSDPHPVLVVGPFTINDQPIPYHWCRCLNIPSAGPKNFGCFDNDSHGLTMMEMYVLWKRLPSRDEWLKERWEYLAKAADWIKWQYDNPELSGATETRIQTDSESSHGKGFSIYPDYTCMEGLLGFAEMADSIGETEKAAQWRNDAARLRKGMEEYRITDETYGPAWTLQNAGWPHHSTILAPVILAADIQGLSPENIRADLREATENSYQRLIDHSAKYTPFGGFGAAMGYSQGFVTQAALLLDRMEEAEEMLRWTARLTYYDAPIEAEKYLVPEGAEIVHSGEFWHRIGDLGNGVQQAETMKTLRLVMGIDNSDPKQLGLFPRMPKGWTSISVNEYPVWIQDENSTKRIHLKYLLERNESGMTLDLSTESSLAGGVAVRFGPFEKEPDSSKVTLNGKNIQAKPEKSGDSFWITAKTDKALKSYKIKVRSPRDSRK